MPLTPSQSLPITVRVSLRVPRDWRGPRHLPPVPKAGWATLRPSEPLQQSSELRHTRQVSACDLGAETSHEAGPRWPRSQHARVGPRRLDDRRGEVGWKGHVKKGSSQEKLGLWYPSSIKQVQETQPCWLSPISGDKDAFYSPGTRGSLHVGDEVPGALAPAASQVTLIQSYQKPERHIWGAGVPLPALASLSKDPPPTTCPARQLSGSQLLQIRRHTAKFSGTYYHSNYI